MSKTPIQFTDFQRDALKEVGNVGSGNAATALSQMVGRRIDMSVSQVTLLSTEAIGNFMGGSEVDVAAVYLPFYGDICGIVLIFFSLDKLPELASMLVGKGSHSWKEFTDLEKSSIRELGSILSGAYLSALFKFIRIQLIHGVPTLVVDMAQAVLDTVMVDLESQEQSALFIETEFMESGKQLTGSFFLIPEAGGLEKLFTAFTRSLGMPDNG